MSGNFLFKSRVSADSPAFLRDHVVYGRVVYPATAYVEMALAVGKHVFKGNSFVVDDFAIENALAFDENEAVELQTSVTKENEDFKVTIFSRRPGQEEWTAHAHAFLRASESQHPELNPSLIADVQARGTFLEGPAYYEKFRQMGFAYGQAFQGLVKGWIGEGEAIAEIRTPEGLDVSKFNLHPAILDACFHAVNGVGGSQESDSVFMPVGIESVSFGMRS